MHFVLASSLPLPLRLPSSVSVQDFMSSNESEPWCFISTSSFLVSPSFPLPHFDISHKVLSAHFHLPLEVGAGYWGKRQYGNTERCSNFSFLILVLGISVLFSSSVFRQIFSYRALKSESDQLFPMMPLWMWWSSRPSLRHLGDKPCLSPQI